MGGWHSGGWVARSRVTALMFGMAALLVALSVLPSRAPPVSRTAILTLVAAAAVGALVPLGVGERFSVGMCHALAAVSAVWTAAVILLAGGTSLSLVYGTLFVLVAQYAAVVFGWRLAFVHVAWGAALHALVLVEVLPPDQRVLVWTVTTGTAVVVILAYRLFERSSARLRALADRSGALITVVDQELIVTAYRGPLDRLLGYRTDQVVGTSLLGFVHVEDRRHVAEVLTRTVTGSEATTPLQARLVRGDDSELHAELSVENALRDAAVKGLVVTIRDVTEQKRLEAQLSYQAFHDPLTGLPNRALFLDRVDHALARRTRQAALVGVVFVDLDDFKSVNDTLGHSAGDRLLQVLAERLSAVVRDGDTIARMGGDEFAVLVEGLEDQTGLERLGWRLVDVLDQPVELGGVEVFVGASVGGTVAAPETRRAADLLRDADVAMYRAKEEGKGRYQRFDPTMQDLLLPRLQMKTDLRHVLERDELLLHYQPTVALEDGGLHGLEALLRWDHPHLGLVPPVEFIPVAEEMGLILPIGRWVLEQACIQAAAWQRLRPDAAPLTLNVNVSGRQLESDGLVEHVRGALDRSGLPSSSLVLEITESVLLGDLRAVVGRLESLRALGVEVAIDDFGTGYSSLSYLSNLPVDLIKVDKSFVDPLATRPEKASLIASVVQVARGLGIRSVAEGIEQAEQAEVLRGIRVDYGQGYHYGRPVDAASLTHLLHGSDGFGAWLSSTDASN